MREYRVQGPPGCGKTTYLREQVRRAAEKYGAQSVVVCSLTRAAAANIVGSEIAIPVDQVGTIHSLAYRAVNASKIAEASVDEWNEFCQEHSQPMMKLSGGGEKAKADAAADDLMSTVSIDRSTPGDRDLQEMNRLRARMIPVQLWPESVQSFKHLWDQWKRDASAHDFTDLVEIAARDVATCPGDPGALLVDESQDCSKLVFSLMRRWGENCLTFGHVGDPDQILYAWAGVDPGEFEATRLPKEQQRLLHQSHRVPRAVHAVAVRWIDQTRNREPVKYAPRDFEGEVRRDVSGRSRDPMPIIKDAKRYLLSGKSVMFCATCSYMLVDLIAALRAEGIAFHNPYRTNRGDWNPLARGRSKVTVVDRLLAFLKMNEVLHREDDMLRSWSWRDVHKWFAWVQVSKLFKRGTKSTIEECAKESPEAAADLTWLAAQLLDEEQTWAMLDALPEWYLSAVADDRKKQLAFPLQIIDRGGVVALEQEPQVIVTTIHAVKGGEADVVYLFPDLSPQAHNEWMRGGDGQEGVRRAFYVGITRARESLIICPPSSSMSVNIL